MHGSDGWPGPELNFLMLLILTIFRHVRNLRLCHVPDGVLEDDNVSLARLESLALIRSYYSDWDPPRPVKNVANDANITRLEVNPQIEDSSEGEPNLLDVLAPQLEHLCISYVPAFLTLGDHHKQSLVIPSCAD